MLPSGGQRASSSTSDAETARIECDVNAAEEMELERLEGSGSEALHGGSPVSSGAA